MDSKDLLSLLKEPLFFDDWVAANFKAINLPSDWLAAQQSPYQILGGDPEALRLRAEPGGQASEWGAARGAGRGGPGRSERARAGRDTGWPLARLSSPSGLMRSRRRAPPTRLARCRHGRRGRSPQRLAAGFPPGLGRGGLGGGPEMGAVGGLFLGAA